MKVIGVMQKPTLKVVKAEDGHERAVIKIELVVEYDDEIWAYLGANAGDSFAATLAKMQREMFDKKTGEVR